MENNYTINVNIAERSYPLKIERSDEERIRYAAKRINDALLQYRKVYVDKDNQDILAMTALQFVAKLGQLEDNKIDNNVIDILEKINYNLQQTIDK